MRNKSTVFKLTLSAILIALATALSVVSELIPFLNLPFGGTITIFSLLPIVLISYMFGLPWGFGSAFVFSLIQIATGVKTVAALFTPTDKSYMGIGVAFAVVFIDYLLAYTSLGLGGVFRRVIKNKTEALVLGSLVALTVCYLFHVLSGALFYGLWAEWFFTDTIMKNLSVSRWIMTHFSGVGLAIVYSFIYNGCYMIPEMVLTSIGAAAASALPQVRLYDGKDNKDRKTV